MAPGGRQRRAQCGGAAAQAARECRDLVLAVAAQQLVGALTGQRHRDRLPREAAQQQETEGGDVGDRFLQVPQRFVEQLGVVGRAGQQLVVVGAEPLRDAAGVAELVGVGVLDEADREGLHRPRAVLGHQRGDERGVQAAAQHRAERDVADHLRARRPAQQFEQPLLVLGPARRRGPRGVAAGGRLAECRPAESRLAQGRLAGGRLTGGYLAGGRFVGRLVVGRPVGLLLRRPVSLPHDPRRRRQLLHAGEQRPRAGHEAERQEQLGGQRVQLGGDQASGDQGLDLGGEREALAPERVVERLHAELVAHQHQPPARSVPQGDREDPLEAAGEVHPVLLIEVDDRLPVALGAQPMAAAAQPLAQLAVVVDLAVEHREHGAVLVGDWLVAAGHVDDAQPPHPERDARLDVRAALVGPAVDDRVRHRVQPRLVERRSGATSRGDATDATHVSQSTPPPGAGLQLRAGLIWLSPRALYAYCSGPIDGPRLGLSHPVFGGDFEARVCLAEGEVSAHGTCEEVFKGVAGPRDASGV